jgi:hypothetical protein
LKSLLAFAETIYLYLIVRIILTTLFVISLIGITFNAKSTTPDVLQLVALAIMVGAFMVRHAVKNILISVKVVTDQQDQAQGQQVRTGGIRH